MTQIKIFYSRNPSPARELSVLEDNANKWLAEHDKETLVVDMELSRDDSGSALMLLYDIQNPTNFEDQDP